MLKSAVLYVATSHQQRRQVSTAHPFTTISSGGLASARLARMEPEEATMKVITHDAIGCLKVNWRLPVNLQIWEMGRGGKKCHNNCDY